MNILIVIIPSFVLLAVAYFVYGPLLARLLKLNPDTPTPAVALRDDLDYVPIEPKFLLSQHFSAIAAAGPIVGPILAGVMFGWAPALIWIVLGSIFIGGVHDMTALVASVRHKACSIAEVVRKYMTRRSYVLFLLFVWIALVYIIVAFTDITAGSFIGMTELENGDRVTGAGIASSSLMYLALPIIMGLLLRFTKLSLNAATALFLPLVGLAIWGGQYLPLDLAALFGGDQNRAHKAWDVLLLVYCFAASIAPMWILLQPRGHLGGFFLLFALGGGALGLVFGNKSIAYPAFTGFTHVDAAGIATPLFPILFITIACGACSGFHSIIASGTTSKQLRKETDATPVAYGSMILEGMVAVVSLACVMMLAKDHKILQNPKPNFIYANGVGSFLEVIGIPATFGVSFGLMAFTTFVYDTLDVCTRLGRYLIQELTGLKGNAGRWVGTALTSGVPLVFVLQRMTDASGKEVPVWRIFWNLFGASNQLLAALTLIGVTVWLVKTTQARWVWLVTGVPTLLMYVMSTWALLRFISKGFFGTGSFALPRDPVPYVATILVGLAVLLAIEAIKVFLTLRPPRAPRPEPVFAPAG